MKTFYTLNAQQDIMNYIDLNGEGESSSGCIIVADQNIINDLKNGEYFHFDDMQGVFKDYAEMLEVLEGEYGKENIKIHSDKIEVFEFNFKEYEIILHKPLPF